MPGVAGVASSGTTTSAYTESADIPLFHRQVDVSECAAMSARKQLLQNTHTHNPSILSAIAGCELTLASARQTFQQAHAVLCFLKKE